MDFLKYPTTDYFTAISGHRASPKAVNLGAPLGGVHIDRTPN